MKRLVFALILGGVCAGCASAQAKAPADRPVLEVPPPPPRIIEPTTPAEPPPPEPVDDLPPVAPLPPPKPKPSPAREAPRTDPKPPEPVPADQPAVATAPVPPAPQLRTPGSPSGPEAAKQVRDLIDRAKKTLDSVDYRRLTKPQREQYDSAKLMLTNAEEQLKGSNFDIARENADKANRIATELQGR